MTAELRPDDRRPALPRSEDTACPTGDTAMQRVSFRNEHGETLEREGSRAAAEDRDGEQVEWTPREREARDHPAGSTWSLALTQHVIGSYWRLLIRELK